MEEINVDKDCLLENLNSSQRESVEYNNGPQLIIACAGSGKTRVLTHKVAYLLADGVPAKNILVLTFTKKASNEMSERINKLVGDGVASDLYMGTFHSVFARILRMEYDAAGLSRNFVIYDQSDSQNTISDILKDLCLPLSKYKSKVVQMRISWLKNNRMFDSEQYEKSKVDVDDDLSKGFSEIGKIFREYERRLRQSNALDFDDILLVFHRMLSERLDVAGKWARKFRYILVDEYQDTNIVQDKIVRILSSVNNRICVVGDDAQSIYAFRGAVIDNIIRFDEHYEDARLFKLEENYRSTPDIIYAANDVISKNQKQIKKEVFTSNSAGDKVHIIHVKNKFSESDYISEFISDDVRKSGKEYDSYTVLYRMNSQSSQIEIGLRKKNIPYKIYSGITFFQREEIKNILAYLKLAVNPSDDESFKRIFDYPSRRIADKTLKVIQKCADENSVSLFEAIDPSRGYDMDFYNKGFEKRVKEFYDKIFSFVTYANEHNAVETTEYIYEKSGMKSVMSADKSEDGQDRIANVMELINIEKRMLIEHEDETVTLSEFLAEMAVMAMADDDDDDSPKVKLMTLHGSKGLEFDTVFIAGCIEGTFPMLRVGDEVVDIDEERRLAYVGMTRAKQRLYMIFYDENYLWGKIEKATKSRFISDLDRKHIEESSYGIVSVGSYMKHRYDDDDFDNWDDDDDDDELGFSELSEAEGIYVRNQRAGLYNKMLKDYESFKDDACCHVGQRNIKLFLNARVRKGDFKAKLFRELLEIAGDDLNALKYSNTSDMSYKDEYYSKKCNSLNSLIREIYVHNQNCPDVDKVVYGMRPTGLKKTHELFCFELPDIEENRQLFFHSKVHPYVEQYRQEYKDDLENMGVLYPVRRIEKAIMNCFGDEIRKKYKIDESGKTEKQRKKEEEEHDRKLAMEIARNEARRFSEENKARREKMILLGKDVYLRLCESVRENPEIDLFDVFHSEELETVVMKVMNKCGNTRNFVQTVLNRAINDKKIGNEFVGIVYSFVQENNNRFYLRKSRSGNCMYVVGQGFPVIVINANISKKKRGKVKDIKDFELERIGTFKDFINNLFKRFAKEESVFSNLDYS